MINVTRVALPCCLLAALSLPGCIVQDIRDNLNKANASLPEVDNRIAQTSTALSTTNTHLEGIDTNLATTVTGLSQTNERITSIESNLAKTNQSLEVVERNLIQVNQHLAGLRSTISKLDSTIPFLDLGGDEPIENTPPQPAAVSTTARAEGDDPQVNTNPPAEATQTPVTNTPAPRDAWVGPWISPDANRTFTLILLANGKYVREYTEGYAQDGRTQQTLRSDQGTWTRDGAGQSLSLLLTQDAPSSPAATNSPTTATLRYRVLHQTSRTLSLQRGDSVYVLKKP